MPNQIRIWADMSGIYHFDSTYEHFRDKKVVIKCKGEIHVGHLWFAGINPLHGQYQVTLDRTPFWPVDPLTIRLYEERPRIHA